MYYQNNAYSNVNNQGLSIGIGSFYEINTTPQLFTLKGKIINGYTNKPLSQAHIYYTKNGVKAGVVSNNNGEYSIQVSPTDILTISFMGFENIEAPVNEIQAIEYLYPKNEQLEEVFITSKKTPSNTPLNTNLLIGVCVSVLIVVIASNSNNLKTKIK